MQDYLFEKLSNLKAEGDFLILYEETGNFLKQMTSKPLFKKEANISNYKKYCRIKSERTGSL